MTITDTEAKKEMKFKSKETGSGVLAGQIKEAILKGELRPGDRVESVRGLASRFGVGRQVAYSALTSLVNEGLLTTKVGSGTVVAGAEDEKTLRIGFYIHIPKPGEDSMSLFCACSESALKRGHELLLGTRSKQFDLNAWAASMDGLLIAGFVDDELVAQMRKLNKPFVICGNYKLKGTPPNLQLDIGKLHYRLLEASYERQSFIRVGAILGNPMLYITQQLLESLKKFVSMYSLSCGPENIYATEAESGYNEMTLVMSKPKQLRPQILLTTQKATYGIARYIYEHKLLASERPQIVSMAFSLGANAHPNLPDVIGLHDDYAFFSEQALEWLLSLIREDGIWPREGLRIASLPEMRIIFNK